MNKAALGVCLVLGGLVCLGGGIGLGIIFSAKGSLDHQDHVAYSEEQPIVLAQQSPAALDPAPPPPVTKQAQPAPDTKSEVKAEPPPPRPAPPELPPVFELPPPAPSVVGVDKREIDVAIDRGVKYLKSHQNLNGTWGVGAVHTVGYSALPGLTLLECGVPPKDTAVQKAAAFVRNNVPKLTATYELSLAILFLDRLGESRDVGLIRMMAMRLVSGQTASGGWDYHVPLLKPADIDQLVAFLEKARPPSPKPLTTAKTGPAPPTRSLELKAQDPLSAAEGRKAGTLESPARKGQEKQPTLEAIQPFHPDSKHQAVKTDEPPAAAAKKSPPKTAPKGTPLRAEFLPAHLQNIPAVANHGKAKGKAVLKSGRDDNSNSQFAMLALWAARRHGLPTDMTLLLAYQRYVASQNSAGGWSYMMSKQGQTPAMTCVGLLGLAMGHGSAAEFTPDKGPKVAGRNTNEDPAIQKGLQALGAYIGRPSPSKARPPMENLYYLWSVERVAMLYNLKTIGGKDWYGWGAQVLVLNQEAGGSWHSSPYHGSAPTIDTCFALLFLKRSNLVQDLTDNLQLFMAIVDPGAHDK